MSHSTELPDQSLGSQDCSTSDNSSHHQESPFLSLPAELRIRIYYFVLIDGQTNPVICTWPSSLGLSFQTSLYSYYNQVFEAVDTPALISLAINKQIYSEACKEFYAKRTFRFNHEQARELIQHRPEILEQLHRVEVEDIKNQKGAVDLEPLMVTLSAAEKIEKVSIGTRALGCDKTLYAFIKFGVWEFRNSGLPSKVFGDFSALSYITSDCVTLQLPTLPKVFLVEFQQRGGKEAERVYKEGGEAWNIRVVEALQRAQSDAHIAKEECKSALARLVSALEKDETR